MGTKKSTVCLLKTEAYGLSLPGVFICGEKIPTVLTGVEKKYLLLAAALLSAVTRLCACTQLVAALMVKTKDMLSIRSRCYDFRLC